MKRRLTKNQKRVKKAILAQSIMDYEADIAAYITRGGIVYLRNTGLKAAVEKIEKHTYEKCNRAVVDVEFPLSKEAFKLMESYTAEIEETIRLNRISNSNKPSCRGIVKLKNLSTEPYESEASKILFKNKEN